MSDIDPMAAGPPSGWYTQTTATLASIEALIEQLLAAPPATTINVTVGADPDLLAAINRLAGITRPPAVKATLNIGEAPPMSTASITVDTVGEIATLAFVDDHGDTDAAAPAGMTAAYTSDNTAVLTVANDTTNPLQGDITPVGEGTANLSVALTDANGNSPPLEADGVTPWAAIDPVAITVTPGAAVGAVLSVS